MKDRSRDEGERRDEARSTAPPTVVRSNGVRQRFLRSMVTHDLIERGLSFDNAYAVARAVRGALDGREEVSSAEIRDLVSAQLERRFGGEPTPAAAAPTAPGLEVIYHGSRQPFSRGVLSRSIRAAGLDLDRAYRLVLELEANLRSEGLTVVESDEIARRVADLLERLEGVGAARRYRVVRRIRNLPRPLVIYIGGASGTGKSTLALELAPLLRIYRINATDTIRQVMRMIFTPNILPALHGSSFEVIDPYEGLRSDERRGEGDPQERLIATFNEQAVRVCVGVRAVVERAMAEAMSLVVEGVHLLPEIIPFADLAAGIYQVPVMLATVDEETHRSRFLARARTVARRAERYLENFRAIRTVHDYLVQQAESHEMQLLDTSANDVHAAKSLRVVVSVLEEELRSMGLAEWTESAAPPPTLLLVIDGLADRPVRALGGRTPLQAARTPTLDRLAAEGQCGQADPIAPGVVADTAAGSLALFAQQPLALKRGPVEAVGTGLELQSGDVALRANLATLDRRGWVVDRRAGRIREGVEELAAALHGLALPGTGSDEVEILVRAGTEHRLAVVLRGEGLSSAILGSDPGEGVAPGPPLTPRPLDPHDERAVRTASLLALFEQQARQVLAGHPVNARRRQAGLPAANSLLTRGAGHIHRLMPLEQAGLPLRVTCVSGDRTLLGLAGWLGARTITEPAMTANLDSDLGLKFERALEALGRSDLVILHVKGADIAAHDQRPDLKVSCLEVVDRELAKLLARHEGALRVAVASDHATLSESGQHAADPLPVLIWGEGIEADEVREFHEQAVGSGSLHRFPLQMLLGRLFSLG